MDKGMLKMMLIYYREEGKTYERALSSWVRGDNRELKILAATPLLLKLVHIVVLLEANLPLLKCENENKGGRDNLNE
jgi:hypothetical protein